jgi:four helix bundle protein
LFVFWRAAIPCRRDTEGYFQQNQFLNIAHGSLEETRYYLILAKDLGYVDTAAGPMADIEEVSRLLGSYSSAILNADS